MLGLQRTEDKEFFLTLSVSPPIWHIMGCHYVTMWEPCDNANKVEKAQKLGVELITGERHGLVVLCLF